MIAASKLPPGQQAIDAFPRWGLPRFVRRRPTLPTEPSLRLGVVVERPLEMTGALLETIARHEQVSDLHCVTTWSRCGVRWSGWRLRDVYERIVVSRARPRGGYVSSSSAASTITRRAFRLRTRSPRTC